MSGSYPDTAAESIAATEAAVAAALGLPVQQPVDDSPEDE